jgi:hypothetical protein
MKFIIISIMLFLATVAHSQRDIVVEIEPYTLYGILQTKDAKGEIVRREVNVRELNPVTYRLSARVRRTLRSHTRMIYAMERRFR